MTEEEIEELLGAYALDALSEPEALEVEAHLQSCPRCRAEVAAHREVAALLASAGAPAPQGLWTRVAAEIHADRSGPPAPIPIRPRRHLARRLGVVAAAALVAVIALLGSEVASLRDQVRSVQSAAVAAGLDVQVLAALARPNNAIHLTSETTKASATVARGRGDVVYWAGSSGLAALPTSETYQLWGLAPGAKAPVSLALLGNDPRALSAFRVAAGGRVRLMVTVEPAAGTATPTTPVVVSGVI